VSDQIETTYDSVEIVAPGRKTGRKTDMTMRVRDQEHTNYVRAVVDGFESVFGKGSSKTEVGEEYFYGAMEEFHEVEREDYVIRHLERQGDEKVTKNGDGTYPLVGNSGVKCTKASERIPS
jgi:ribosomal protein S24E